MTERNKLFEDAFNLMCGKKIGEGAHRDVFEYRMNTSMVVKVENDLPWRYFANVLEMHFWSDHQNYKKVADWLAPCRWLSPDGLILLQDKCRPLNKEDKLPDKLPGCLTDVKIDNFGMLGRKLVCFDYAMTIPSPSIRMKKVIWDK